jgi:hypothetical protein
MSSVPPAPAGGRGAAGRPRRRPPGGSSRRCWGPAPPPWSPPSRPSSRPPASPRPRWTPRSGPPRLAPLGLRRRRRRGAPARAAGGGGGEGRRRRVAAVTELHDRRGPGRHTGPAAAVSSLGRRRWGRGRRPGRQAAAGAPLPWRVWAVSAPGVALGRAAAGGLAWPGARAERGGGAAAAVGLVAAGLAGGRPARRRRRHHHRPGLRLAPGRAPGPHPPVAVRRPGRRRPTPRSQTAQFADGVRSRPRPPWTSSSVPQRPPGTARAPSAAGAAEPWWRRLRWGEARRPAAPSARPPALPPRPRRPPTAARPRPASRCRCRC